MYPSQYELVPRASTSQPNKDTPKFKRMVLQLKKSLLILRSSDLADESDKPMLRKTPEDQPSHDSSPPSMSHTKDSIFSRINFYTVVLIPRYNDSLKKPVKWLRIFTNVYNVDYVKCSYLEGK